MPGPFAVRATTDHRSPACAGRQRDGAGNGREFADLSEQRIVDGNAGRDEGDRHRRPYRRDDDPVDFAAQRGERRALARDGGIVEQVRISEGRFRETRRRAGVGGDRAVETDEHHAGRADAMTVIAQHRQLGVVIVLGDGLAQRIVERQNLDIVGDALRKNAELAQKNARGRGEFALRFLDQAVAKIAVGDKRRQQLHRRERHDQEEREAVAEAHGFNSPTCACGSCRASRRQ